MKLKIPVTKIINLKMLNQRIHIFHNIKMLNILFLSCDSVRLILFAKSQLTFTCSKSTIETLKKAVKYVQS